MLGGVRVGSAAMSVNSAPGFCAIILGLNLGIYSALLGGSGLTKNVGYLSCSVRFELEICCTPALFNSRSVVLMFSRATIIYCRLEFSA